MPKILARYKIGRDFTEEEYHKWKEQLVWWIESTMPKIENPHTHAENVLLSAMNGTKLDGKQWSLVPNNFFARVKVLAGFDLEKGVGVRRPDVTRKAVRGRTPAKVGAEDIPPLDAKKALELKSKYKKDLLQKYPHLENPVYDPKVDELAETVIRGRMMSQEFMVASAKELERLNKIRESLNKQVNDLMNFLEISPKLLVEKQKATDKADVGSLVAEMESYGEIWQDYERLDALRELLQKFHQLNNLRPDGTQQLNDWELWHMTRNRPVRFTCECGKSYTLLGGFTPEEIEQALVQAQEVYGFGLEGIEGNEYKDEGQINEELLPAEVMAEKPTEVTITEEEEDEPKETKDTDSIEDN
jgi:hypothetical protein